MTVNRNSQLNISVDAALLLAKIYDDIYNDPRLMEV